MRSQTRVMMLRAQGPLDARWLDPADCVGVWEGDALAAAVFPTADSVPALRDLDGTHPPRRLCASPDALLLRAHEQCANGPVLRLAARPVCRQETQQLRVYMAMT